MTAISKPFNNLYHQTSELLVNLNAQYAILVQAEKTFNNSKFGNPVLLFDDVKLNGLPSNFSEFIAHKISSINTEELNYKSIFQSTLKNTIIAFVTHIEIYLEHLIDLIFSKNPQLVVPELDSIFNDKSLPESKRVRKITHTISQKRNSLNNKHKSHADKIKELATLIGIHEDLEKAYKLLKSIIDTRNLLVHENTSAQLTIEAEEEKITKKTNINIPLKKTPIIKSILFLIAFLNQLDSELTKRIYQTEESQ